MMTSETLKDTIILKPYTYLLHLGDRHVRREFV